MADTKQFPTGNNIVPKSTDKIFITDTSDGNEMKDTLVSDLARAVGTGHTHDDLYYRKSEVDSLISTGITGGTITRTVVTVTTGYTVTETETTVLANASGNTITVTLPPPSGSSVSVVTVKVIDNTYTVTINSLNSELIEGETSIYMEIEGESLTFMSNGTSWFII
jgi:hypothetical protein